MPSKREQLLEIMEDAAKGETKATLRARIAELEAEVERLTKERDNAQQLADINYENICTQHRQIEELTRRAEALSRTGAVKVRLLEWVDADEGMCTKWRAAALGGHYELVVFEKEPGFAVNFHWGRPLSFWFIQGEPDEWGPTGPKMFRTLEAAKAAAQADYERRILSALEPAAPEGQQEPVAWRWKPKDSAAWIYDPKHEWLEAQSSDEIDAEPLYTRPTVQAVTEAMVRAAAEILIGRVNAPEQEIYSAAAAALKAAMEARQ